MKPLMFNPIKTRIDNLYTISDIFEMFFTFDEYEDVWEDREADVHADTLGYENGDEIYSYEDEYISMEFEKGEGTTIPHYYDEGGLRFYNNNILKIKTKEGVRLNTLEMFASTPNYALSLEYVSGDEVEVEVEGTTTTVTADDSIDVTFSTLNYTERYTQSRIYAFDIKVKVFERQLVASYDNKVGNTYPFHNVLFQSIPYERAYFSSETEANILDKLFILLYERYFDWYVISIKGRGSIDKDEVWNNWTKWCSRFLLRFNETYQRYGTLISIYEKEQSNLLRPIYSHSKSHLEQETSQDTESESRNRFNDTPQVPDDGTLEDDNFLSQYSRQNGESASKGTGTSDSEQYTETARDTIMARIDELQEKLVNLWEKWVDEFQMLFYN